MATQALTLAYAPPRLPDTRAERTALHAAARALGWRIGDPVDPAPHASFHVARIETGAAPLWLLLENNGHAAALSPVQPVFGAWTFTDAPALSEALAAAGSPLHLFSAADLDTDLTPADRAFLTSLNLGFEANLAYWRPRTVGSVIFNWWD